VSKRSELCGGRAVFRRRGTASRVALSTVVGLSVVGLSIASAAPAGGLTTRSGFGAEPGHSGPITVTGSQNDHGHHGHHHHHHHHRQFAPYLVTITPSSGTYTTLVTLTGRNLFDATVHFDGVSVAPTTDTTSQITVRAPNGVYGDVFVDVTTPKGTSNQKRFDYRTPFIKFIRPRSGFAGTKVLIHGYHLDTTGKPTVTFLGTPAKVLYYSFKLVKVVAPSGFGTEPVHVTTKWGTSNAAFFTYRKFSGSMP
jgi:IPT/TIG domain